ncbi:hypothetical protein ACIQI8_27210 [Streptomyces sp. NPDC092369]|uniref:hypothetical protein n=1 Tax=Streptomyces sp. NPDC092369 TaxID=3366015 RepID=UPI00380FD404
MNGFISNVFLFVGAAAAWVVVAALAGITTVALLALTVTRAVRRHRHTSSTSSKDTP